MTISNLAAIHMNKREDAMAFIKGLWRKIKHFQIYDRGELNRALDVDISTIYNWVRLHGLQPINPGGKVALFEGKDVIDFLRKWEASREVSLKPGELYCVHCKQAVFPILDSDELQPSGTYNKDCSETMIQISKCSNCGKKIAIFLSGKKTKNE